MDSQFSKSSRLSKRSVRSKNLVSKEKEKKIEKFFNDRKKKERRSYDKTHCRVDHIRNLEENFYDTTEQNITSKENIYLSSATGIIFEGQEGPGCDCCCGRLTISFIRNPDRFSVRSEVIKDYECIEDNTESFEEQNFMSFYDMYEYGVRETNEYASKIIESICKRIYS